MALVAWAELAARDRWGPLGCGLGEQAERPVRARLAALLTWMPYHVDVWTSENGTLNRACWIGCTHVLAVEPLS